MLQAGGDLALSAKAKLVNRDRCAAWGTDLKANINVSEENEALLLQTDLHLTVEIWAETTPFLYFSLQGSEGPIPVKLALMAERVKIHPVNFLGYDLSNTGLYPLNRNFACLYQLAVLQPKHFSPSSTFQLHPASCVRQWEHHVRAACSSRGLCQLSWFQ